MSKTIKTIALIVFAASVVAVFFIVLKPYVIKNCELAKEHDNLLRENAVLEQKKNDIMRQQELFNNNPEYVELVARKEGQVRANETVYDFSE